MCWARGPLAGLVAFASLWMSAKSVRARTGRRRDNTRMRGRQGHTVFSIHCILCACSWRRHGGLSGRPGRGAAANNARLQATAPFALRRTPV